MSPVYGNVLERGGRLRKLLAIGATVLIASVALAQPAKAELAAVGPVNNDPAAQGSGQDFPFWFQDTAGLRLALCIDGTANCLAAPGDLVPPAGEAFWFNAAASGLATGTVEMATEATFLPGANGQDGPVAFNRVRMRLNLPEAGTYRVTYPYGQKTFTVGAGGTRAINDTSDIGCTVPPCGDFAASLAGEVGPFLTWDTFGTTGAGAPPVGYIGDAVTPHPVVGSPTGNNFVSVDKVDPQTGVVIRNIDFTDRFLVQGKIFGVTAFANPKGGTSNQELTAANGNAVTLTASDTAAEIRWTTDTAVADANIATSGTRYSGPIDITDGNPAGPGEATTTLRFVAIDPATGQASPVKTETYNIDTKAPVAPTIGLAPESDSGVTGDNLTNVTTPKFNGTAESRSTVKVFDAAVATPTLLGQTTADDAGNWAFTVPRNKALTTQGLHDINATSTDAAGNTSGKSANLGVTLDTVVPKVVASPGQGVYGPNQKFTLTPNEAARVYFTTDRTIPDATDTEYTAPLSFASTTTLKYIGIDTAGNRSQVATQVYTIDRTSPKVDPSSRIPAPNAVGIAPGTNVTASFNEAVKGVSGTTFTLKRGAVKVAAVVTYDAVTRKAVLNPSANLAPRTKYTVTLTGGIQDSVGNPLVPLSWSFTTR